MPDAEYSGSFRRNIHPSVSWPKINQVSKQSNYYFFNPENVRLTFIGNFTKLLS
jgi:hypothetical protein